MKTFKALRELIELLASVDMGTLAVHDKAIAERIEGVIKGLEEAFNNWRSLTLEQRASEEINALSWNPSTKAPDGEYLKAELAPNLKALLESKGGKTRIGAYMYYLSKSGRYITRYKRGE